jgi:hypothetical protein
MWIVAMALRTVSATASAACLSVPGSSRELLASVAPNEVAVADRVTHSDTGGGKNLVAVVVTEGVVDVLEVVEI